MIFKSLTPTQKVDLMILLVILALNCAVLSVGISAIITMMEHSV